MSLKVRKISEALQHQLTTIRIANIETSSLQLDDRQTTFDFNMNDESLSPTAVTKKRARHIGEDKWFSMKHIRKKEKGIIRRKTM